MGTFVFRWPYPADSVYVTGTFDDWGKSEKLDKIGDVFEKEVHLSVIDQKIYYKFVVDDQWIVDQSAPKEDDGHYNVNNILLPHQITKSSLASTGAASSALPARPNAPRVLSTSHAPPGTNGADGGLSEAPTVSAGGEGAPLLSKEESDANLARWIPHTTPDPDRPTTRTLPPTIASNSAESPKAGPSDAPVVSAGGEGAPLLSKNDSDANLAREIPHVTPDPDRPVTRTLPQTDGAATSNLESKSEEASNQRSDSSESIPGAFPETPAAEPATFGIAPLPATGHSNLESSVTTSKEDYENASGEGTAGGNVSILPVLEPGQQSIGSGATTSKEAYDQVGADDQTVSVNPLPADGHKDTQSSVTTSKEAYEKAGALGVAGAAIAGAGAYVAGAFSKPKQGDKNIIPESSLSMDAAKTDSLDAGPFISSAGPGSTTADLASKVPFEPKREAQVVDAASSFGTPVAAPFISSSGPGTTTADLASKVPLEIKPEVPEAPEAPQILKEETASPFITSSGPGTTTAALASQVPLEQKRQGIILDESSASPAVAAEKSAVEEELLQKVPQTQATGEPAAAAAAQTSYYGLATSVPEPVEQSIAQAHASPEAATETSVVAEKSAVERELQSKVPLEESAGEPAPVLAAATSATGPGSAALVGTDLPETNTSTQADAISSGKLAAGAIVGGVAGIGAATFAAKHANKDVEPARVDDASKSSITAEAVPVSQSKNELQPHAAGIGAASTNPGVSPIASAALSDGTEVGDEPAAIKNKGPVETSEATATEYAPPRQGGLAPGVSPSAAAALSDGCEDPTLSEEPAVQMMKQNATPTQVEPPLQTVTPVHNATTVPETANVGSTDKAAEGIKESIPVGDSTSATGTGEASTASTSKPTVPATSAPATPKKAVTGSTASTPARGTPDSSTTGDKKKKRHRLSQMIKKIFD